MANNYEKHMKMLIFGIVSIVAVIIAVMLLSTLFMVTTVIIMAIMEWV